MKIVYLGAGAFGLPTLERLQREHTLCAIVTQPDRPAGRRRVMTPTPVAAWALQHAPETTVFKPEDINEPDIAQRIRDFDAEAWVVIAFGQKLGAPLLADRFAINLHASLLPRWRGAAPINHAILAGDHETGNTVITIADRMDAGLILGQSRRPLDPTLTAGELHDLLALDGPELMLSVLDDASRNELNPIEQDESQVTRAPKLRKADGWVDFTQPARTCRQRIHGLTPWPGVAVEHAGCALKLLRVEPIDAPTEETPGTIIDAQRGVVACGGNTSLILLEVQPAGRRAMPWSEYARGRDVESGQTLQGGRAC